MRLLRTTVTGLLALGLAIPVATTARAATWYVRPNDAGAADGSDWGNASSDIEDIFENIDTDDEVWVAEGQYDITAQIDILRRGNYYGGFEDSGVATTTTFNMEDHPTTINIAVAGRRCMAWGKDPAEVRRNTAVMGFIFTGADAGGARDGAGVYTRSVNGTSVLANCVFAGNTGRGGGGFIASGNVSPTVRECRFIGNVSLGTTGNNQQRGGGGALVYNADPIFIDCVFVGNSAALHGGAICFRSSGDRPGTIENCVFTSNVAERWGGAVALDSVGGSPNPTFTDCRLVGNTAKASDAASDGYQGGGALFCNTGAPTLMDCVIQSNTSFQGGGGIAMYLQSDATITDCLIAENVASGTLSTNSGGGGILCRRSAPTVTGCDITSNVAMTNGGGVHLYVNDDGDAHFEDCRIMDNAQLTDAGDQGGGGVYARLVATTFTQCVIADNYSASRGGGVHLREDEGVDFHGCSIFDNVASVYGGGAAVYSSDNALFSDCILAFNTCLQATVTHGGGGVYLNNSNCRFEDSRFVGNLGFEPSASNNNGSGGALSCNNASPSFASCVFSANSSTGNYGGGRGGYVCQTDDASPVFESCLMAGNTGRYNGGVLKTSGSGQPALINCTLAHNSVNNRGGICFSQCAGGILFANCLIAYNSNRQDRGVVDEASGADHTLDNNLFWGNTPHDFYDEGSTNLDGTDADTAVPAGSVAGTVASDPLFLVAPGGSWTFNPVYDPATGLSTLALGGDFEPGELAGLMIEPDTSTDFQTCIVSNTATDVTVIGDIKAWGTPGAATDYQVHNYQVDPTSPAVDGGTDTVRTTPTSDPPDFDLAGALRPATADWNPASILYDIGAYERVPDSAGGASNVEHWMRY